MQDGSSGEHPKPQKDTNRSPQGNPMGDPNYAGTAYPVPRGPQDPGGTNEVPAVHPQEPSSAPDWMRPLQEQAAQANRPPVDPAADKRQQKFAQGMKGNPNRTFIPGGTPDSSRATGIAPSNERGIGMPPTPEEALHLPKDQGRLPRADAIDQATGQPMVEDRRPYGKNPNATPNKN